MSGVVTYMACSVHRLAYRYHLLVEAELKCQLTVGEKQSPVEGSR